jgi:hypothetical protein
MAVVVGLGLGAAAAFVRVRGGDDEENPDQDEVEDEDEDERDLSPLGFCGGGDDLDERRTDESLQPPLVHVALWGAGAGLAAVGRNWRGPGFRVVGLRRVDARTGGPVGVRSVLIGVLFDLARQSAARPLFRARARRERHRRRELAPKLNEIERKHVANRQARRRAVREFHKENKVNPVAGCGWQVAGPILSQLVLAAAIRNGRTVYDRFTGTMVVTDR